MKLKLCITDKIFAKICLKLIRDMLLKYAICYQGRDGVRHEGKGEDSFSGGEWHTTERLISNKQVNKD